MLLKFVVGQEENYLTEGGGLTKKRRGTPVEVLEHVKRDVIS